jgi:hypothetical protein
MSQAPVPVAVQEVITPLTEGEITLVLCGLELVELFRRHGLWPVEPIIDGPLKDGEKLRPVVYRSVNSEGESSALTPTPLVSAEAAQTLKTKLKRRRLALL